MGIVAVVLLGPEGNPEGEWYERAHTGTRGPTLLLENIEIVTDRPEDAHTQEESHQMAHTTQGVDPRIAERILQEETLEPRPLEKPTGRPVPHPRDAPLENEGRSRQEGPREQVSMSRPAQQSAQFVLLHSVQPRYPEKATPLQRQRLIVVAVQMYVNEKGEVAHALISRNEGGPHFAEAVLRAVRQWRYEPLVIDGRPEAFWDQIRFVFRVGGGPATASELVGPGRDGG